MRTNREVMQGESYSNFNILAEIFQDKPSVILESRVKLVTVAKTATKDQIAIIEEMMGAQDYEGVTEVLSSFNEM